MKSIECEQTEALCTHFLDFELQLKKNNDSKNWQSWAEFLFFFFFDIKMCKEKPHEYTKVTQAKPSIHSTTSKVKTSAKLYGST